jgi:fructokinase
MGPIAAHGNGDGLYGHKENEMSSATGTALRIGVDLGGTKTEAIAIGSDGAELQRRRIATPATDYTKILHAIRDLVTDVEAELQMTGTIGVAAPGAISRKSGRVKNSNTSVLNGKPLDADLAALLGRPVRIANDANCFALSEAIDGAGAAADVVFGVILGTGVGGGIVVDKRIVTGRNGIAGEWGHNILPWASAEEIAARPCYCGKAGCVETFLCGPALARDFQHAGGSGRARAPSARDVVAAARTGDEVATACLRTYSDRLARGLASVINVVDPDIIVLGGGVSNIAELYAALPPLIDKYAFSDGVDTPIVPARHGDSSGVRGAAWLWPG